MKKRHSAEQIVKKLHADALRADGMNVPDVCRQLEVSVATYHQWRKKYRGMDVDQAKRLKELEKENGQLKRLLGEKDLDIAILKEAAAGNL